jgi:enoyl-CoA hydratase/carnithine racemase
VSHIIFDSQGDRSRRRNTVTDAVSYRLEQGIADVRLNRPDKMNAVDEGIMTGLKAVAKAIADDPRVRVVVLSGEGGAFCSAVN